MKLQLGDAHIPSNGELTVFIRTHVTGNLHIIDHPGLAAAWVKHYVLPLMPPGLLTRESVEAGWTALAELCAVALPKIYQKQLRDKLKALLEKNYPKALRDPTNALCVIYECTAKRAGPWGPACAEHTCAHCQRFIGPDWRKTHALLVPGDIYKSYGLNVYAHLVPRTMLEEGTPQTAYFDRVMKQCQYIWETHNLYMSSICPGDLQPCATVLDNGYYHSPQCGGAECIPRVVGAEQWDAFRFCAACWPLNECKFALSGRGHLLDPTNPHRREALVCADEQCNLGKQCVACHKWWFVARYRSKGNWDTVLLCPECQEERLCCPQCKRLSWKKVPGVFFAPRWIYPHKPQTWNPTYLECILCLPTVERPLGKPRAEHKSEAICALLITWRIRGKAERTWFEEQLAQDARATLGELLKHDMTDRERALAARHPDFFWDAMVRDCTLWNSTWWLMYQTARLPKDLFLKVLRLVCFVGRPKGAQSAKGERTTIKDKAG